MWSSFEKATKEYKGNSPNVYENNILAQKYSLLWAPTDKSSAENYVRQFFLNGLKFILINTPSIGQYWATKPAYKYKGKRTEGEGYDLFIKCGPVDIISKEVKKIKEINEKYEIVPTPHIIETFKTPDDIYRDDIDVFKNIQRGKILIEEFINSISLGHALIDHRFDVENIFHKSINSFEKLHSIGYHGDFKHQHIRICVSRKDSINLIKYSPFRNDINKISIRDVCFIDFEDFEFNNDTNYNKTKDLNELEKKLKLYLSSLSRIDKERLKIITIFDINECNERISKFINLLREHYYDW